MAQHTRYWSCSSFADWLRGTAKPMALGMDEWGEWNDTAKIKHSFRYWLAEDGLGYLQDFVTWPVRFLYNVKYYIVNRWVLRTNSLTAHRNDIKPGNWCDVGNRFLPCLFNELVDFIEVEQAWSHIAWGDKEARAKYDPPFWASGWFRWRTWRSPEAGIDHLKWASKLTANEYIDKNHKDWDKPTHQAIAAMELLELYTWWKEVRPARPDPYEVSGWNKICVERRATGHFLASPKTAKEKRDSRNSLNRLRKIEEQYEKEDTDMLIRLIKIRNSLWT